MSSMTYSIKAVVKEAMIIGESVLDPYSNLKSPKKFTQAQIFGCLVLKAFLDMNYRETEAFLGDFSEVRKILKIKHVPHYTTLQKASVRILQNRQVKKLLAETLLRFQEKKAA